MHVLSNCLFSCLFLIAVHLPCCQVSCPGGENQPYTWYPDFLHKGISWELRIADGAIVPLTANALDLDPGALTEGEVFLRACRRLHWGLSGDIKLTCSTGNLVADTSGCRREGCVWHRFIKGPLQSYEATYGESVDSFFLGADTKIWTSMVLSGTGIFYALPFFGPKILRIDSGTGAVSSLEIDPSFTSWKAYYSAAVMGKDNLIYGVPYTAPRVLRIDPSTDEVTEFPDMVGSQIYKWSHGVLAHDGQIYCVPAYSPHVMMIDPKSSSSAFILSIVDMGFGIDLLNPVNVVKWIWGVLAPNGEIYCIPDTAPSVLRIDPFTQSVSLHGSLGSTAKKWCHGLVGIDGRIYGVPSSAESILRIDASGAQPVVEDAIAGLSNLPTLDYKWSQGVAATNGLIYCIPRHHNMLLVINPATASYELLAEVPGGTSPFKYGGGVLAPDGKIYAFPENERQVMKIDPSGILSVEAIGDDLGGVDGKFTALALAPNGDMLGLPGKALQVLWIHSPIKMCSVMPPAQNATCTLGLPCVVTVTGFGTNSAIGGSNIIWIGKESYECFAVAHESLVGAVMPVTTSFPVENGGRDFTLGTIVAGVATYSSRLCWAPDVASLDIVQTGTFTLLGPYLGGVRSCTLGLQCSIRVQGLGLLGGSVIFVIPGGSSCGDTAITFPIMEGLSNPHALSTNCLSSFQSTSCDCSVIPCNCTTTVMNLTCDSMTNTTSNTDFSVDHGLGSTSTGVAGVYNLCWSQGLNTVFSTASFNVLLSEFRLVGPQLRTQGALLGPLPCWSGYTCDIELSGTDLSSSNRLTIRNASNCLEASPLAVIGGLSATVTPTDSSGNFYNFGVATEGGTYGDYAVCWHVSQNDPGIFLRSLKVYGPVHGGMAANCTLGYPCGVQMSNSKIVGVPEAFSSLGRLMLVPQAGSCPGSAATLWPGGSNPSAPDNSTIFFHFGTPTSTSFAESQSYMQTYALCWSRNGNAEAFNMRIGTLLMIEVPCAVPHASFANTIQAAQDTSIEPCQSLDTSLFVNSLQHTETCSPRCAPNFDSSVTSLTCQYGILIPSSYECRQRCLNKPYVTNGLDQAACVGMRHGDTCVVNCPPNHIKSGNLVCTYGAFLHDPTIAAKLLFDVPRCYESCQAQTIGCEGSETIVHGGTCTPMCPSGSTASVNKIECFDGQARPASFECFAGCATAPDIPHSQDLSACASSFDLGRCILACASGYLKSGDPICRDGVWSSEQCFRPCQAPSLEKVASPSCQEGASVTHLSECTVKCEEGYAPEVSGTFDQGVQPFLLCIDGTFSPPSFVCKQRCMRAPIVDYADELVLAACIGTRHGETCPAPCLSGYEKTGDFLCSEGEFSNVVCRKKCDDAPVVANMLPSACAYVASGQTCEVQCQPGYTVTGVPVCQDGTYSQVECVKSCAAPIDVLNSHQPSCVEGAEITSGQQCTPRCAQGFTSSRTSLQCTAGNLDPFTFRCSRLCGQVGAIRNAGDLSDCASLEVGKICELKCVDGFKPFGQLRCDIGGWAQYRGEQLIGTVGENVEHGRLMGIIQTAADFELSFEITLMERATMYYQSILHVTATGNNCCEIGDRVPALLLMPAAPGSGKAGDELYVFMDSGPGCEFSPGLELNKRTHIIVSFIDGILKLIVDGKEVCVRDYGSFPTDALVDDAKVYAGSPWDEAAIAELADVEYKHAGLGGTMPTCVPVLCDQPVPRVSGARTDMPIGQSCVGKPYGFECSDIPCVTGTKLVGKFTCGGFGTWLPEDGSVVCATSQCPKHLPTVRGLDNLSFCDERQFDDLCAVRCLPGYIASGAFTCGAEAQWVSLSGSAPMCIAKPCGPVPVVPNSIDAARCSDLPSGTSCTIPCSPLHIPLGRYSCEAQLWAEAPICVPQEMLAVGDASYNIWIVKAGLAAEPSSEVQQRLPSVRDWADVVARAASSALSAHFTQTSGKTTFVAVLALVGSALTETGTGNNNRLLQDSYVRPRTWRADVSFAIIPNGTTNSDAQELADDLTALTRSQLELLLMQALPSHASPASMLAAVSSPRLVELPPNVVRDLHILSPLAQVFTKTITTTQTFTQNATAGNGSNSSSGNRLGGLTQNNFVQQVTSGEETDEGGMTAIKWLFVLIIPFATLLGCLSCYRFTQYNQRRPSNVMTSETADWKNCIEAFRDEDVMEGIDEKKLTDFLTRQAADQRAISLKQGLTGHDDPSSKAAPDLKNVKDIAQKNVKDIARDWKNTQVRQEKAREEAREEAKKYRFVRFAVYLTRRWRKKEKRKKLNLKALEDDFSKKQDELDEALQKQKELEVLEEGLGEKEYATDAMDGEEEEEEHQDDEDGVEGDSPKVHMETDDQIDKHASPMAASASDDPSDQAVDEDCRPEWQRKKERKSRCRSICVAMGKLCELLARRLLASPAVGKTFRSIFDFLDIKISEPTGDLTSSMAATVDAAATKDASEAVTSARSLTSPGRSARGRVSLTAVEEFVNLGPQIPPALMWEFRHFKDNVIVQNHLVKEDGTKIPGHWIDDHKFTCSVDDGTWIASFKDNSVLIYWSAGRMDNNEILNIEDNMEPTEEVPYNNKDFFEFAGQEELAPPWANAPPFFDFKMSGKTKAAAQAEMFSSVSDVAGNVVTVKKELFIDYQKIEATETVTTKFHTPNRTILAGQKSARQGAEDLEDDYDEEGTESDEAEPDPEGSIGPEHHPQFLNGDPDGPRRVHRGEGGEEETLATMSILQSDDDAEGVNVASNSSDFTHGRKTRGDHDERLARQAAIEEEERERRERGPDTAVLEAVRNAQASTLYQHLSEKHRSQAAKEHMGVDMDRGDGFFGNIAEAFENAENLLEHKEITRAGKPTVLGGSLWDWVAGKPGPGPCGK